jgi:pSer/pThr/pTyr-binding forkhead associated (FHA) protein
MAIQLHIVDVRDPGLEHVRSFVQDRVIVGRARSCDVCLPDMAVSTRHAEIRLERNEYKAVDLGSRNGTFIDGARLVPHRPRRLANGDVLGVAGFDVRFRLGVAPGPPQGRDESAVQAREILAGLLARTGEKGAPALLVIGGPGAAARYALPEPPASLCIGRAADADVRVDDRGVTKRHAEVVREGGRVLVRALDGSGGVVVGGQRVSEAELLPGLPFTVGATTLALELPLDGALAAIQGAPEEDTSTFSAPRPAPLAGALGEGLPPPARDLGGARDAAAQAKEPLPIGPEDPLIAGAPGDDQRTTREMARPELDRARALGTGDLGLIAVGAILLVAAVVGLVLLLT